jgi:hypothetical protein
MEITKPWCFLAIKPTVPKGTIKEIIMTTTQNKKKPLLKIMTLEEWLAWIPGTILDQPKMFFDRVYGCDVDVPVDAFPQSFEAFINQHFEGTGVRRRVDFRKLRTYFGSYDPRSGLVRNEEGRFLREFVQRGYMDIPFVAGAEKAIKRLMRTKGLYPHFLTATPGAFDVSSDAGNRFGSGEAQSSRSEKLLQAGLMRTPSSIDFVDASSKADRMLNREYSMPFGIDDDVATLSGWVSRYGIIAIGIRNEWTPYNHGWEGPGLKWFESIEAATPFIEELVTVLDYLELLRPAQR